jgi:hypothetical protein
MLDGKPEAYRTVLRRSRNTPRAVPFTFDKLFEHLTVDPRPVGRARFYCESLWPV